MKKPLVSVIVPTRNSAQFIGNCLESISKQTYKHIEIIVVDQESSDDTKLISKKFTPKVFNLPKSRDYTPPTKSRNNGARESKGQYLLHIDSDMVLTPLVVEECVFKCEKEGFGALVIHEIDVAKGFWGKCKALERKCYIGDKSIEGARFVSREVFDSVDGYDEKLNSGEDWDIHQRYKKIAKIGSIKSFIKHYPGEQSFWKLVNKKYHYGKSMGKYLRKHPKESKKQLTLFRSAYFKNWKLFVRDPVHTCGFVVLRVSEFVAGGFGLIIRRVGG